MAGVQLTGDWNKLRQVLDGLATISGREVHRVVMGTLLSSTRQRFRTGFGPDNTKWTPSQRSLKEGGQTLRDTGDLLGSITGDFGEHFAAVGTNKLKAAIHQFGGTIKPDKAKALAIPISREAKKALGPRDFPRELDLVWPRGSKFGWLVEHKAGRGAAGKGAQSVFHYRLAPKVEMPARPFLGISTLDRHNIQHDIRTYYKRKVRL